MGGINTLSGLNKVGVDYRPQIGPDAPNVENAPQPHQGGGDIQEHDDNIIFNGEPPANTKSMVRQLDTLLLNAATKSVSANTEAKMKDVSRTLVDLDIIAIEDAEKLESLAKDAADKLKALDNFSGRELAKALMTKSGELVWRKGFFGGMSAVTRAVKAAVEAQETLSEALGKFNESLAGSDRVDAKLQESFTELQFQCDRRATEIYSVVVRMHDLAQQDAVSGVIDEQVMEYLTATFKELMPREAILMHGTAEALETMKAKFADQMHLLADKLDAFKADGTRTLSVQEAAELDADMATMKNTLANVRKNGIEIDNGHTEVDKTLLDEMEKILAAAHEQIDGVKEKSIARSRAAFRNEVRLAFDLYGLPDGQEVMDGGGKDNPLLKQFREATQTMLNLFEQFETGDRPMDEFDDAFDTCKSRFPDEDMLRSAMRQVGFDSAIATNFSMKTIRVLDVVAAQFKELMRHGESLKASDAESMVMADDVRRIMLGEAKLSVYVEAKSRGFKLDDVDPRTDTSNIAKSKVLGSGVASTTYLLTTHAGEELVFKPELDSRFGLHELNLGKGGAYLDSQKAANLNLATQQTAKTFGCEDIVVKYSVGVHDGQFGCFMEKAKGFSGKQFVNREDEGNGGIAPAGLRLAIGNTVERTNIQGKIAQKLNKLMWLDLITGQGDRHWDNYFINIDKTTHEVTLKAIDNDASFSAIRIGLQKYVITADRTETFKDKLWDVCQTIHKNGAGSEYNRCLKKDPGFTENDDNTITVDLSKVKSPELAMAILKTIGLKSIAIPEEIDHDFYKTLMDMDRDKAKKEAYLRSIAPRISPAALKATEMRLNDAIEHAKKLAQQGKVYGEEQWRDSFYLGQMTKMQTKVTIEKSDHTTTVLRQNPQGTGIVNDYLETSTPSFYKREFFNQMFG